MDVREKQVNEEKSSSRLSDTPHARETILSRFRQLCAVDSRVEAAFVGGSLATGTADQFSDLDIYLITSDAVYDAFFTERKEFVHRLGDPVYLEDFDGFGFDMVLFILANGVWGELGLGKASHFLHIHGGPYRVLVDKTGILKDIHFPLYRPSAEAQRDRLKTAYGTFWRHILLFVKAMGRNRLLTASSYFDIARKQLLLVCRLSIDFQATKGMPVEELLPQALLEAYSKTFFPLNRTAMLNSVKKATQLFPQVAKPLARVWGIDYPEQLEIVVMNYVNELNGADPSSNC
ncbi:MAG: aminoglycoside 6-adenylyltransferase [Candidatus Korarchaeota archaeon]|nr:aminoglycoside 6-adenylyltransferase [Candidatus Korarchaeota archaeon]NIU84478.1 hypothetical protein [Candidatus Thorarchaeota archaeon]NIW14554.1 hypothetical protein [Candidatus Thorarchaeota archaeon]NIW52626.1 hypothetical protein [Candidatus Korarchaeota archaeon]